MKVAASRIASAKPHASSPASTSGLLQRKCACGGSASALTGQCEECGKNKVGGKPLQRKLVVNRPGDAYEQEADRAAEAVMRMPQPPGRMAAPARPPLVQRRVSEEANGLIEAPPIVHDVISSPGQPLDAASRAFFEPRFGHSFGDVRVHTDATAAESAGAVDALAYTVGQDVVFGEGRYAPGLAEGKRLLAHELAHTAQQIGFGNASTVTSSVDSESVVGCLARQTEPDAEQYVTLGPTLTAAAERELPLPGDGVFFDGTSLSVKREGRVTVNRARAVSGKAGAKEYEVSAGPIPDGVYHITPRKIRPPVTDFQSPGVWGAAPIGSGFQEVPLSEELVCIVPSPVCGPCTEDFGPAASCATPVGVWGPKRIAIEGTQTVVKPGGGTVVRDGFYLHGGKSEVTATSGCIKLFDDAIFDELQRFKKKRVPLIVAKTVPSTVPTE